MFVGRLFSASLVVPLFVWDGASQVRPYCIGRTCVVYNRMILEEVRVLFELRLTCRIPDITVISRKIADVTIMVCPCERSDKNIGTGRR